MSGTNNPCTNTLNFTYKQQITVIAGINTHLILHSIYRKVEIHITMSRCHWITKQIVFASDGSSHLPLMNLEKLCGIPGSGKQALITHLYKRVLCNIQHLSSKQNKMQQQNNKKMC